MKPPYCQTKIAAVTGVSLAMIVSVLMAADHAKKPDDSPEKKSHEVAKSDRLPTGSLKFVGKLTGKVESVILGDEPVLRLKVESVIPDEKKNKATGPESLIGLTVKITPLRKRITHGNGKTVDTDKTIQFDEKTVAYIRAAETGSTVTLEVRVSKTGEIFRMLAVP